MILLIKKVLVEQKNVRSVMYGLVFTGWGIAGVIGPVPGGMVADKTGTYTISYLVSAILLIVGSIMVFFMKSK